jgi:hypothetical protein
VSPRRRQPDRERHRREAEEDSFAGVGVWGEVRAPRHGPARAAPAARERFRHLDRYRVDREWRRYEGTAQRDLFRVLRVRFLQRHARRHGWALEIGPGPGRFSPRVGLDGERRVVLDLSQEALLALGERWSTAAGSPLPHRVRGDALYPPLRPGSFELVVALGNTLGFSGAESNAWLDRALALLRPGGTIVLESVAGPGESSTYLSRLPPGAVGRLFASPPAALRPRLAREGFRPRPDPTRDGHPFRRLGEADLIGALERRGFEVTESIAVAPLLGADRLRVQAIAQDARRWANLLALEEEFGRQEGRRALAAALLVAAERTSSKELVK